MDVLLEDTKLVSSINASKVSILIVMDVLLEEVDENDVVSIGVSILIVMDVLLEDQQFI